MTRLMCKIVCKVPCHCATSEEIYTYLCVCHPKADDSLVIGGTYLYLYLFGQAIKPQERLDTEEHVRIWIESVSFYFFPSTCRARWWKFNENILGRRGAKFIVFELSMSWTLELEDQYFNNGAGYSIWWMNSTRRSEDGKWTSSQNDWRGASERGTTDVRSWGQTYSGWLLYFDMRARGAGERVLELVDRSLVDMYLHEEKIVAIKIAMSVSSQTIQPGGIRYECLEIIKIKINAHLFTLVKVADY